MLVEILLAINAISLTVLIAYAMRQYIFIFTVLRQKKSSIQTNFETKHSVSIIIPARNEAKVLDRTLQFMSQLDYPKDKLEILVLNDASTDNTSKIAHQWADRCPAIKVIDRAKGGLGKVDVLNQGIRQSINEIIFIFDADYTPAPDTLKKLIRWFDDPKVGLVQGNIHVVNKDANFLTKMIHAERSAGFLCDLVARDALKVTNQYGGTAGGFRRELIAQVGEWAPKTFCEDTDLTCRTMLAGYKVKYDVSVDCGEEAPDRLKVYYKQRYRWTRGHIICALKYSHKFLASPYLSLREKIEGILWLNVNTIPILAVVAGVGWLTTMLTPVSYFPIDPTTSYLIGAISLVLGLGATIGTVFVGLRKVKQVNYLKFSISLIINSYIMCYLVCMKAYFDILTNRPFQWIKTERNGIVT